MITARFLICFSFDRMAPLGYNCDPFMSCERTGTIKFQRDPGLT
jgi:hypothetical protein